MKINHHYLQGILLFLIGTLALSCGKPSSTTGKDSDARTDTVQQGVHVTAANFVRAETDTYFATSVSQAGSIGQLYHFRELMPIDHQSVVRANRDVLYSSGVFDLDAGPVTITMPDPGKRFMSLMTIDEDHYAETFYAPGTFTFSKEKMGTRYMMVGIRTFVNPNDEKDIALVKALQDSIKVEQAGKGSFEIPDWDEASQKQVRDSLIEVSKTLPDSRNMFGPRGTLDETRHLIGSAVGWGGNAEKDAFYILASPPKNDGNTVYKLKVNKVPVDGFWSVSVYNQDGYFEKNELNSYSVNNVTARKDADGGVTIQFGGCSEATKKINCIPVTPGWNYTVRLYRPHPEILNGTWKFPELVPVK
jgi:hypothetical protein